ncbi:MAG: N-acetylmuramic acid 6-phosphate etherase [Alphaproteobacteria bacterium]|nr:N-acetylmuramic acid 6-phosphate etherase [Alphaproteobacteria bacterium]
MITETEKINIKSLDIDMLNGEEIAYLINNEDKKVAWAVSKIIPDIGDAIEKIASRLRSGGKMAYFGAGTSGRIGVLDSSEMPPTFGVDPNLIQGYIAGGEKALRHAVENAEDKVETAEEDFRTFNAGCNDVVVAISASGNPNYTLRVLQLGREVGALTIAITSNSQAVFKQYADIFLCTKVGAEIITGSSRMKSGTAQKMVLNMLSTGVMIRLGKVYHNYMVDLQMNNKKLFLRAIRFVCEITGTDEKTAQNTLSVAGNVKTACVMIKKNCDKETAENMLLQNEGILRRII